MKLAERLQVKKSPELSLLCHRCKNLFNLGNWLTRQDYFHLGNVLSYYDLNFMCKDADAYRVLPAQTAQQVLRLVAQNWKAYFRASAEYRKNQAKFLGRPRVPKYKAKDGECVATFTSQQCRCRGGFLHFHKKASLPPLKVRARVAPLRQVRVLPRGECYVVEVVYERAAEDLGLDKRRAVGVDIGVANLATVAGNAGQRPFVAKGGAAKAINHFFNKRLAELRSAAEKGNAQVTTRRIRRLCRTRDNKIWDIFHKVSRYIVNYCIANNIGTIVVGYNPGWKQHSSMGRRANQIFVQMPFRALVSQVEYKAVLAGITTILVDERYTSRCSAVDGEVVGRHARYAGERVSRGLFRTRRGTLMNADVNGAYNILRQAFPNALADGIKDTGLHPVVAAIL
ncbi:MAG TPA: transposase [Candidatus Lokiarchaeia archaeon]|nr:transposase [Candidatus Lokiarchaeia archaeon]